MGYKHSSGEFLVDAYIMRHHRSRWARAAVHMTVSSECYYFFADNFFAYSVATTYDVYAFIGRIGHTNTLQIMVFGFGRRVGINSVDARPFAYGKQSNRRLQSRCSRWWRLRFHMSE